MGPARHDRRGDLHRDRDQLGQGGAPSAVLRGLVPAPSPCLRRDRARVPAPARCRRRLHPRLDGPGWWHGHPFSLSSAPNGEWLRITVKALGDGTRSLQRLAVGTRVLVEGPYGVLTGARRRRRRILLIAGGIGIAPLRALVESLPAAPGEMTLLYR